MPEYIKVKSPFIQKAGGATYQILLETTAEQVKTGDGGDLALRMSTLERAVAGVSKSHSAADIAARDALIGVNPGDVVFVRNATGDKTVNKGAAFYMLHSDGTWEKLAETESMDAELKWAHIQDKPGADVADIDLAAAQTHTHINHDVLANLADLSGELGYMGQPVHPRRKWIARARNIEDVNPSELANPALVFVETAYDCYCDCEGCENTGDLGAQVYLYADGQFEVLDILGKGNLVPVYASAFSINEAGMLCVDDTESGGLRFKITNSGYLEASNG